MRQIKRYAVVPVIILALFAQACGGDKIREARKAAYRIQVITDAATDTTATLFREKIITTQQKNQIVQILLKVNAGNLVLINQAAAAKADTPEVRANLLAQVRVIANAVKELKAAGVLGIKSANGELAFNSAISALDSALALIEASLAGGKR